MLLDRFRVRSARVRSVHLLIILLVLAPLADDDLSDATRIPGIYDTDTDNDVVWATPRRADGPLLICPIAIAIELPASPPVSDTLARSAKTRGPPDP